MNANELADALEKDPMRWTILENAITMLRQQQAEIEVLKEHCSLVQEGYNAQAILLGVKNAEISKPNAALLAENIVKGGNIKIAVEALEQIATGKIAGEQNNYKDTVSVMRIIAKKALLILGKA